MVVKDCENCGKHRARWLVEVIDTNGKKSILKVCGICKWRLWPSPRKMKPKTIVRVLKRIRGSYEKRRLEPLQPPRTSRKRKT